MKHQNINVIENGIKITLNLGRQGEYNVRDIKFDMSDFQQKYGDGTATIVHYPASGSAYTVPSIAGDSKDSAVLDSDNILTWTIGRLATMHDGYGIAEITWITVDGLKKSIRYNTYCKESIGNYGADRTAQQSYIDQMVELASTITDLSSEFSDAERIAAEIVDARENAVSDIEALKNDAVSAVNTAKSESIEDIGDSKESALDALNTAKQTALTDIESAKQNAETDINAAILIAETHANNASQSATSAQTSATSASNSADSASQSATSASQFADNASNSANSASQSASNASSSANNASQSATSAQTSATNASTSEQNARQSAEDAQDILDSVQAEGNTQIGRVQAKGQEVLDSLPEDFTQVQNDIASLNGSLSELQDGSGHFTDFVVGGLDSSGELTTAKNSIVSSAWFTPTYPLKISVDSGYQYRFYFNDSGTVTFTSLTDADNTLFVGRSMKIYVWKTNVNASIDYDLAVSAVHVQTVDNYKAWLLTAKNAKRVEGYELFDGVVQRGGLGSGNGKYISYLLYRCVTPYVCRYDEAITITPESGFKFGVLTFDSEDAYSSDLGWKTAAYTIAAGQGFKLSIARTAEDTSEIADARDFIQGIKVNSIYATTSNFEAYKTEVDADIATIQSEVNTTKPKSLDKGFLQLGGRPHLAAHGGYHVTTYPYNSIPAYEEAGKLGYWGIETDVNQTSDGYLITMHDTVVDTTTDGTGRVADMTLEEIRALHLTGTEYLVPTFEEYLAICKRYSCVPIVEIKSTVDATGIALIVETLKSFGLDKTCIITGSKWNRGKVRAVTTEIPYLSIYQSAYTVDFDDELEYNATYDYGGLEWDFLYGLTLAEAKKLHDEDMLFATFTVDVKSEVAAAFAAGVDFVITNTVLPTDALT